jgi:hypothetical protein
MYGILASALEVFESSESFSYVFVLIEFTYSILIFVNLICALTTKPELSSCFYPLSAAINSMLVGFVVIVAVCM